MTTKRVNLTDAKLRKVSAEDKEIALTDLSGLVCRILPSGRKIFCWRFRDKIRAGKYARITYGDYPDLTLADARNIHRAAVSARKNGKDIRSPAVTKEIIHSVVSVGDGQIFDREACGTTFSALRKEFIQHLKENSKDLRAYNRIKNHVEPTFGNYDADIIPSTDIEKFIQEKRSEGMKERTLADSIRFTCKMYEWGKKAFLCKTSPFENYRLKRESKKRKSFYNMQSLRTLLLNPEGHSLARDYYLIQKALILSGARRSEVIKAEIREVNFDSGNWSIPPERLKNQQQLDEDEQEPFVIPMPKQLRIVLYEALEKYGNQTHIFGSKKAILVDGMYSKQATGPSCDRNYDNYITAYRKSYRIENKTNHDLRRTIETHLTNLGVSEDITTAMTGHTRQGMKRVYNQATQIHVLRTAFQMWGDFIDFICENDEAYAIAFDEQTPGDELREIYCKFNFHKRLSESLIDYIPA